MPLPKNPFFVTGKIDPQYFCDRESESARLLKSLTNGSNVVLISPRRMGKTGLIDHCFSQKEIQKEYYTVFIDILHTTSLREMVHQLGKAVFDALSSRSRRMARHFVRTITSLQGHFGVDPVKGTPTFSIELGDIDRPEFTLEEIFRLLDSADRPCLVAIDEFQQVMRYGKPGIEALLRSHVQRTSRCHFVFAGSERGLMQAMFLDTSRPFYRSADVLALGPIPRETYIDFAQRNFALYGKTLPEELAARVYDLFEGHTFYVQKAFNECFASLSKGKTCSEATLREAIATMLDLNAIHFRETLSRLPEKQKMLLYAIALEGKARHLMSADFIQRHRLDSPASVQTALAKLQDRGLVTTQEQDYLLTDRLFALWIRRKIN